VDPPLLVGASTPHGVSDGDLVVLDPDHPGFRDATYRARRNDIARLATQYREGDPVPTVEYTDDERAVWAEVWRALAPLHDRYACRAYHECARTVRLDRDRVPQLADVNLVLAWTTGFSMRPVAGLVASRTFMSHLARGTFLATQYMRHPSRPLYTPEPDVIHELVGHAVTFCHPDFARLNRAFGEATDRADDARLEAIARVYWYTLEFGVVREEGALRVYGAGLLSSFGELGRFERETKLVPLDLGVVAHTPYDPTDYQKVLFVAEGWERVVTDVTNWLGA
jgi:phenylalanine-4-hydroxylase